MPEAARVRMSMSTVLLLALNTVIWGWLSFSGFSFRYANKAQADYYFYIPVAVLALVVAWTICFWRSPFWVRNLAMIAALLLTPIYLFFYTGGM
jgi:hypothetical protein